MESWKFQFGATPKFHLEIVLKESILELTIQNGLINKWELKESSDLNRDASFQMGLNCLVNTRLCYEDLKTVFDENNLLQINENFENILGYFNKNIS